jgi:hypothetical protein
VPIIELLIEFERLIEICSLHTMSRFLFGDDLGNIKSLRYRPDAATPEERAKIKTLLPAAAGDAGRVAAQKIAVWPGTSAESSLVCSLGVYLWPTLNISK